MPGDMGCGARRPLRTGGSSVVWFTVVELPPLCVSTTGAYDAVLAMKGGR